MLQNTLPSVLDLVSRRTLESIYTSLPGVVQSYDPVTQSVDVQLAVKVFTKDEFGDPFFVEVPVLSNVPVNYPRSGGMIFTFPITKGDSGLVTFPTLDTSAWELSGQVPAEPLNVGRHGLSSCVFTPGWFPDVSPPDATDATARGAGMVLGKDGGPQIRQDATTGVISVGGSTADPAIEAATTAKKVYDALAILFDTWTPVANDGGAALKAKWTAAKATLQTGMSCTKVNLK